jgi:hypothetical protein
MRAYTGLGLAGTDRPVAELYDMASGRRVLRLHDRPTDHYTVILRAWFYPHFSWNRVDNDLAELPTGLVPFDNVLFDVRGVVQLRRTEPLGGPWQIRWGRHPARLDGIAVHRPFHRLHALLGTDQREQDGWMIAAWSGITRMAPHTSVRSNMAKTCANGGNGGTNPPKPAARESSGADPIHRRCVKGPACGFT